MDIMARPLTLQLFAEGGTAAAPAEGGTGAAAETGDLSKVAYGLQADQQTDPAAEDHAEDKPRDLGKEFDALIKGEYRDVYNKRMQDTIQRRTKGTRETADKYRAAQPLLQMLSERYHVDVADVEGLTRAVAEDDAFYEQEAERLGIGVEQVKTMRKAERENAQLREQLAEQENRRKMDENISKWMREADEIAAKYPQLDLQQELQNPQFFNALMNGASVEGAYWGLYHDQLIPQAMQFTAQETERKIANKIQSQGKRPTESGAKPPITVKSDVSQLSDADMDEIIRRARRGEKIRF